MESSTYLTVCVPRSTKYSRKVVICAGISRQQGELFFVREGWSDAQGADRNDRTGNSREQGVKVPQKFTNFEQSCQEEVHI